MPCWNLGIVLGRTIDSIVRQCPIQEVNRWNVDHLKSVSLYEARMTCSFLREHAADAAEGGSDVCNSSKIRGRDQS